MDNSSKYQYARFLESGMRKFCEFPQRAWSTAQEPVVKPRVAPRPVRRPSGKAPEGSISPICDRRATQSGRDASPVECSKGFTTGSYPAGLSRSIASYSMNARSVGNASLRDSPELISIRTSVSRRVRMSVSTATTWP